MRPGFRLDGDAIRAHARDVAALADRVELVAAAGRYTGQLSEQAFGLIGEVFAGAARDGMEQGVRDVSQLAEAGAGMARGLHSVAACYERAERANAELFGGRRGGSRPAGRGGER